MAHLPLLAGWLCACPAAEPDPAVAELERQVAALEARLEELEAQSRPAPAPELPAAQPPGPKIGELAVASYEAKLPKAIRLEIREHGVKLGPDTLDDEALGRRLESAVKHYGDPSVTILATEDIPFERVTAVLTVVRDAGVERLAFSTPAR